MITKLETISFDSLDAACGGANNTQEGKGNIGVDVRGAKIGVQGEYKSSTTDYATCLKAMTKASASPATIVSTCGKPGDAK